MLELRTVLCPTDFSAVSVEAVRTAARICEHFGARLVVHHSVDVFPPILSPGIEVLPATQVPLMEEQEQHTRELLRQQQDRYPGLDCAEPVVGRGQAHRAILELARDLPADLIVMGAHGTSGLRHLVAGSTTERVLSHSPCPVLALRSEETAGLFAGDWDKPRVAVVALDLSEHSRMTVEYVRELAQSLPIRLDVVHVIEPMAWRDKKSPSYFDETESERQRVAQAQERLRARIGSELPGDTRIHVLLGNPAREIVRHADEVAAALIVMGTRRKSLLEQISLGKTSHGVLRASRCPVWYVQSGEAAAGSREKVS